MSVDHSVLGHAEPGFRDVACVVIPFCEVTVSQLVNDRVGFELGLVWFMLLPGFKTFPRVG